MIRMLRKTESRSILHTSSQWNDADKQHCVPKKIYFIVSIKHTRYFVETLMSSDLFVKDGKFIMLKQDAVRSS